MDSSSSSSPFDAYPATYRGAEVQRVLKAARAGECVSVIGLSGAGKSNLMGFLGRRVQDPKVELVLADGNRMMQKTAGGLFRLARAALCCAESAADPLEALDEAVSLKLADGKILCLLVDRLDVLSGQELELAGSGLRSLRDAHKYRLACVTATRRPLDPSSELAELFYANQIWLGPLSREDAAWSAGQYAARREMEWEAATIERLVELSGGYPSLLRAACEAHAAGAPLEMEALRQHPTVQRRVQEFWADEPTTEMVRLSGLEGNRLLAKPSGPARAELTASEHRLLVYLEAHAGQVCEKDDLIRAVWPEEQWTAGLRDDSLAQLVRRLREKIEPDASRPLHVITVPGRGYRFER